jgi:hypothetical protein
VWQVDASTHPGASIYGWSPNVSSWGASIQPGDEDGLYHMFAAQMKTGGLVGWGSQSECVHAVSRSSDGPFTKHDIALGSECHGPVVIRHPGPSPQPWLMFHQGSAGTTPTTNSSSSAFMHHALSPNGPWTAAKTQPAAGGGDAPCGMPTAAFHPNGTLFAVCQNGHSLWRQEHWDAPWTSVTPLAPPPSWEDPSIW